MIQPVPTATPFVGLLVEAALETRIQEKRLEGLCKSGGNSEAFA
ncbi:hypothetical protein [Bradyrhizobium sp. CCBAU 11357]|nr:hypothetical protein [Bradyrhizobium sp. CCBAU 11357]